MKTLLLNPVTHLFLRRPGEWTIDPNQAMSFRGISDAVEFQISHHLNEAQVFLKLEGIRWGNPPAVFDAPGGL